MRDIFANGKRGLCMVSEKALPAFWWLREPSLGHRSGTESQL